jgi:DNA-binding CsgD family transcriptional regulator
VRVPEAVLCEQYGLTAAEARVASLVAEGLSPEQIARARKVSLHTVRSQIRAVYDKLGVHRQVELAGRLMGISSEAAGMDGNRDTSRGADSKAALGDSGPAGSGRITTV